MTKETTKDGPTEIVFKYIGSIKYNVSSHNTIVISFVEICAY